MIIDNYYWKKEREYIYIQNFSLLWQLLVKITNKPLK